MVYFNRGPLSVTAADFHRDHCIPGDVKKKKMSCGNFVADCFFPGNRNAIAGLINEQSGRSK